MSGIDPRSDEPAGGGLDPADQAKLDAIAVTQPVDLDALEAAVAAIWGARYYSVTGAGLSAVSAETVVATLVIPAQPGPYLIVPVAGTYCQWSSLSATAHQWSLRIRQDNVSGAVIAAGPSGSVENHLVSVPPTASITIADGATKTIVSTVARISGSNTVTTFADGTSNRLGAFVVPAWS